MKLRNKKTREIHEITQAVFLSDDMNKKFAIYSQSEGHNYAYRTLAELNEEWEDYEEPKSWWYIDCNGEVFRGENADKQHTEEHKSIGNYYTSSKEAEKAVRKLKAWKRLKDMEFKFIGKSCEYKEDKHFGSVFFELQKSILDVYEDNVDFYDDLGLLFGGEE